jgi:hypothetical protein
MIDENNQQICTNTEEKNGWLYNSNYWYWTMTNSSSNSKKLWEVGYIDPSHTASLNEIFVYNEKGAVRPVINLYKSKL